MFRIFIIVFILTSICFSQQTGNLKRESLISGEDIVRKAKEIAGISQKMTSFQIKLHNYGVLKTQGEELVIDTQEEITVASADKIRNLSTFKDGGLNRAIWNGNKFRETVEFETSDGQRKVVDTTDGIQLSQNVLNAIKSKKPNNKSMDSKANVFSDSLWNLVFPFILSHPIETSAKFEYLGRAQAGEKIANFVQTTSANGHLLQMFFDEKTNNLLLLIEKYKKPDRDFEIKYYYSNYEKRNGVLVPTKVKIEHKVTPTGQLPITLFEYIDLVDFEVNPITKPEIFKIN